MSLNRAAAAAAVRALDLGALARERWFAARGETVSSARLAHAFALSGAAALALVDVRVGEGEGRVERYTLPLAAHADGSLAPAAPGDGVWRALAVAMAEGRTIPALGREPGDGAAAQGAGVDAALVCRPSPGFAGAWPHPVAELADAAEAPLGRDQSNTSAVLGGTLLLKAYRRIVPGLNPDLEMTAYLSEEAAFAGVPRLAGWAEAVTRDGGASTVAMLQAFIAHAQDAYEATAERLAALVAAPGTVSVEWATEIAEDLGVLVAGLHGALASPPREAAEMTPRPATHDELKLWRLEAHRRLNRAIADVAAVDPALADELRDAGAQIAARASRFEALVTPPLVMRVHADLHLGRVLLADDGYRVIGFEGDPLRPAEERRRLDSPLRDVASMLRSLDHVARSARRRAEQHHGSPIERPGLDVDAWIERARERFLAAYAAGLRHEGAPALLDRDLLDAFEVAKGCDEFSRAATGVPSRLRAPREGMRWLLAHGER